MVNGKRNGRMKSNLCLYMHVSWHLPTLYIRACLCVCERVCVYPVLSQCVVAGGLLYEGPVVLQTGLTWGALLPRLRLLHCSHLVQAGEGLTVLSLETHTHTQIYNQHIVTGNISKHLPVRKSVYCINYITFPSVSSTCCHTCCVLFHNLLFVPFFKLCIN